MTMEYLIILFKIDGLVDSVKTFTNPSSVEEFLKQF